MAGVKSCQSACKYCSAATTMDYNQFKKGCHIEPSLELEFDKDKVVETFNKHPNFVNEVQLATKQNRKPTTHIDIWGANPLFHFTAFKQQVEFLRWYFEQGNNIWKVKWQLDLHTSDNGLSFASDLVTDYMIENNIHVQLSHDGLGQWIRTGDFDPLAPGSKTYDNLKRLFQAGILDWINCTMSAYNTSFLKNIQYFNKVRVDMDIWDKPIYIKLNHIYDSTYDIKAINEHGYKNGEVHEELIGKPIGNMAIRGRDLADYFGEFIQLALMFEDDYYSKGRFYGPYVNYITSQVNRFKWLRSHDEKTGACRAFQRYRHQIGEPEGWSETTFVIDSMGRYSECNLIDGSYDTKNPGGVQPEHCKGCRFEMALECNQCGTEPMADDCEYLYWLNVIQLAWKNAHKEHAPKHKPNKN